MKLTEASWQETLDALGELANQADALAIWPAESWRLLKDAAVLRWCITAKYDGAGRENKALLEGYESLAGACLTTCFILSQRDAACRRIRDHGNDALRNELLPALARGDRFATVGLSHLTTSRQHLQPALVGHTLRDSFVLKGVMPWVTGAAQADFFVTGAVVEDGKQILLVLPRDTKGVRVGPASDLMALAGSLTGEVYCDDVQLEKKWLLAGPAEKVLTAGRGGTGGIETSCLALGLAGAAIDYLCTEAKVRSELQPSSERLDQSRQTLRQEMHHLAEKAGSPEAAINLRARANTLVLRATQAALTASKGTGFLRSHPAQRWARQALFFLVWSCPRPAAEATLAYLSPTDGQACL